MLERMHLHAFEYSVNRIGVLAGDPLSLFNRIRFDDDQAACLIGERSRQNNFSFAVEGFQSCKMSRPMDFAFCLAVRAIKAKDDEFHRRNREFRYTAVPSSG